MKYIHTLIKFKIALSIICFNTAEIKYCIL